MASGEGMESQVASPGGPGETFEIAGSMKWFDLAKGYGFIKPSAGHQGDVLLHQSYVRQSGSKCADEVGHVVGEAIKGPKGLPAQGVQSHDDLVASATA